MAHCEVSARVACGPTATSATKAGLLRDKALAMNDAVLTPGMVVGETYDVENIIGRGAMGEVYSALHRRLPGLRVAIKVMTGQTLGADRLMRFRREAEIAAKLSHPNIVQIIDYNTLPTGQPYLVMEFLRGESLHSRLKRGPLKVEALKRIVREVGAALEAAHQAGVVHRDLKPENIYLVPTPTGDQAKVLDFGISKLADGALVLTSDSMIIGTPRYMSPEQAMGLNSQLTARSDLFSFATVCYEALTGKPMFESENVAQLLYQIAQVPHVPLQVALPEVPQNVARAIENALAKDPVDRTPDVATFVRELTGSTLGSPAPAKVMPRDPSRTQEPTRDEHVAPPARSEGAVPPRKAGRAPKSPPAKGSGAKLAVIAVSLLLISGAGAFAVSQWLRDGEPTLVPPARPAKLPTPAQAVAMADAGEVESPGGGGGSSVAEVVPSSAVKNEAPIDAGPLSAAIAPTPAPRPRAKHHPLVELPPTEQDQAFLEQLTGLYDQRDWAGLIRAQKSVMALSKNNGVRRKSMLMVLEAMCARRETTITSTFNRLSADYPFGVTANAYDAFNWEAGPQGALVAYQLRLLPAAAPR